MSESVLNKIQHLRLLILDVDGVLTDGKLWYGEKGEVLKIFHVHDGLGIKNLLKNNIHVAVISSRQSTMVERRMQELGVNHVFQGQSDKLMAFTVLLNTLKIKPSEVATMGDDLPDLPLLERSGLAIAVANAISDIKSIAHLQTKNTGGNGAVREICDLILHTKNHPQ